VGILEFWPNRCEGNCTKNSRVALRILLVVKTPINLKIDAQRGTAINISRIAIDGKGLTVAAFRSRQLCVLP
jgi:hypothetical protein